MNMIKSNNTTLAIALHGFLAEYLPYQRSVSPHTLLSYRDTLKLLLKYMAGKKGDTSCITIETITVEKVTAFLHYLESERKNQASTRNVRLSAIHSFFRYIGTQYPEHLEQTHHLLSIPFKRNALREIQHLEKHELEGILSGINRSTPQGKRDFTLPTLLFNTGARVSEIVNLQASDLRLCDDCPAITIRGKGKKERVCPLWPETARLLTDLLEEEEIFPNKPEAVFRNRCGARLTRFGVRVILQKHVTNATPYVPSLKYKRIHPHSLRHTTAVQLLRSGVDLCTIARLLGHSHLNTTNKYIALDVEDKRQALARSKPLLQSSSKARAWQQDNNVITWLENL